MDANELSVACRQSAIADTLEVLLALKDITRDSFVTFTQDSKRLGIKSGYTGKLVGFTTDSNGEPALQVFTIGLAAQGKHRGIVTCPLSAVKKWDYGDAFGSNPKHVEGVLREFGGDVPFQGEF